MNTIKSTVRTRRDHDANRPFGPAAMIKGEPRPTDPTMLEICNDPLPAHKGTTRNKYEGIFKKLAPGKCIKCSPHEVARVGNALRKYCKTTGKAGVMVKTVTNYGDGMGRIWVVGPA